MTIKAQTGPGAELPIEGAGAGGDGQGGGSSMGSEPPLSYTEETIRRSPGNGRGYFERRELLYLALHCHVEATCSDLAAELGWSSDEVSAKLMSLRRDGMAYYDGGTWYDPWDD